MYGYNPDIKRKSLPKLSVTIIIMRKYRITKSTIPLRIKMIRITNSHKNGGQVPIRKYGESNKYIYEK